MFDGTVIGFVLFAKAPSQLDVQKWDKVRSLCFNSSHAKLLLKVTLWLLWQVLTECVNTTMDHIFLVALKGLFAKCHSGRDCYFHI